MALRESATSSGGATSSSSSALPGLPAYWDVASTPPRTECEKWWDIFVVAVNAEQSISVNELMRTPTENEPRVTALINGMNEQAAERKVLSILFLSLGSAGRTNLTDKFPYMVVSTSSLKEVSENGPKTFKEERNLTLERYRFFARKQQPNETLRQFWNALTGLALRCDFEQQTESLIMDAFIQNMHNRMVQGRLCIESKVKPQEALRLAIAFEGRISQQKNFGRNTDIKNEPVYAIDNKSRNPCTRCGLEFTTNALTVC